MKDPIPTDMDILGFYKLFKGHVESFLSAWRNMISLWWLSILVLPGKKKITKQLQSSSIYGA